MPKHAKPKKIDRTKIARAIAVVALASVCCALAAFGISSLSAASSSSVQAEAGYRSAIVSWNLVPRTEAYRVTVVQGEETLQQECKVGERTYTVEGLAGGIECAVTVESCVEGQWFPLGSTVSVTPEGPSAPEWFMQISDDIVAAAKKTPTTEEGYCAEWVENVFRKAGYPIAVGDACTMYWRWCTEDWSTDRSQLVAGMIIASPSTPYSDDGRRYGHVGIYIGDDLVMDSIGRVTTKNLDEWIARYGAIADVGWGIPFSD